MTCEEFWNSMPEDGGVKDGAHLAECPACAARMRRHAELEAGFRAVSAGYRRMAAPPRVEARLLAAFRRQAGCETHAPSRRWIPAATWVVAFAAMFALAAFLVRNRPPEVAHPSVQRTVEVAVLQPQADSDGFIPLPNSAGVTADEDDVNLVRMEVPRSAMIALGLDVNPERAQELVEADVMLGSNGMARAVRFLD